jgi:hypothetical protein
VNSKSPAAKSIAKEPAINSPLLNIMDPNSPVPKLLRGSFILQLGVITILNATITAPITELEVPNLAIIRTILIFTGR